MTQKEIRVGIVGANAKARWAKVSHVPAIKGLPGMKLAAVVTRNEQSAREAAASRSFKRPFRSNSGREPLDRSSAFSGIGYLGLESRKT